MKMFTTLSEGVLWVVFVIEPILISILFRLNWTLGVLLAFDGCQKTLICNNI